MFGNLIDEKKKINNLDMDNGLKIFLENDEIKSRKYSYTTQTIGLIIAFLGIPTMLNCPNCQNPYDRDINVPKILIKCGHTLC